MSPADKLPGPMLGRREILHMTAALASVGFVRRNAAAASAVRLISGFGAGNPTDLCVQLIQDGLMAALDEPVLLDYAIGEAGMLAAREVIDSNPDGKTLLVTEILNLVLHDARGGNLLPRLTPIAKITRGFSTAIIHHEPVFGDSGLGEPAFRGKEEPAEDGDDGPAVSRRHSVGHGRTKNESVVRPARDRQHNGCR
jgi:hypothetical protein